MSCCNLSFCLCSIVYDLGFFLSILIFLYAMYHQPDHLPCLHCHPHSYIRLVQHLIERCLLLRMTRDQCIKALSCHAGIHPIVTFTGLSC
ncbi:hypothetical protein BT93_B2886 [Corymbia citriodora subsp. variegata]|nr:hypothetical protein BT93_B2886 [Corymbia citriodora subsp. variegata]